MVVQPTISRGIESGLVNRYTLPKLALSVISIASLVGVYLTMAGHGTPFAWALIRWVHLSSLGILAGGAMWWGFFMQPSHEPAEAKDVAGFGQAQVRRFRRIGLSCLGLVVLSGANVIWFSGWTRDSLDHGLWTADVIAYGLWVGGAVWNIFIAVPAAKDTLSIPVVVAAARQLEKFRWAVRFILPTLILTGLLQAYPYTGFRVQVLLATGFGQLILVKLGLVVALIGIFITCPMWRACSPIQGMCDLDDLEPVSAPDPVRTIDNRGKACAGFVKIQKVLREMSSGEGLELLSTDPFSWWELPAWLEKHGYRLVEKEKSRRMLRNSYRFLIET